MPALPAPLPTEKLHDAVDLIVVPAVGKGEQLIEKLAQPGRVPGKDDSSRLEIRQLSLGARQLVALRLNADGSRHTRVAANRPVSRLGCRMVSRRLPFRLAARLA